MRREQGFRGGRVCWGSTILSLVLPAASLCCDGGSAGGSEGGAVRHSDLRLIHSCREYHAEAGGSFVSPLPATEPGACPGEEERSVCAVCSAELPVGVSALAVVDTETWYYEDEGSCAHVGLVEANQCAAIYDGAWERYSADVPDSTLSRPSDAGGASLDEVGGVLYSERIYEVSSDGGAVELSLCNNHYGPVGAWPVSFAADETPCPDAARCYGCLLVDGDRAVESIVYGTGWAPCMDPFCASVTDVVEY